MLNSRNLLKVREDGGMFSLSDPQRSLPSAFSSLFASYLCSSSLNTSPTSTHKSGIDEAVEVSHSSRRSMIPVIESGKASQLSTSEEGDGGGAIGTGNTDSIYGR